MSSLAVQSTLNFQVRKSSRGSLKSKENSFDTIVSPKRKLFGSEDGGSPEKKIKNDSVESPSTVIMNSKVSTELNESLECRLMPVRLFPPNVSSYKAARRALHSGIPDKLQCRDEEINKLKVFLSKSIVDRKTGSLYMSGPPGTGKTASLTHVLDSMQADADFDQVWVNCMALRTSASIYEQMAKGFGLKSSSSSEKVLQNDLEDYFTQKGKMLLVVLDELDQLSCKFQSILYSLFEYPGLAGSRLVLVGISNALDLTDRLLPRLQAKLMAKSRPELLNFAPYTKQQLATIINERLLEACSGGSVQVIKPAAVQLLSVKIASVAGDARKALDIARRAIDMAEAEARKQTTLRATADDGLNPNSPRKNRPGVPVKSVDPVLIMKVFNQVYGSRVAPSTQYGSGSDDGFPVQQKIVLCTLLLFAKSSKQKEPTVGKMHDVYTQVCRKRNVTPVDQSEFWSLCGLLESRGFVNVKKHKSEIRMAKVSLRVDGDEIASALQDKTLIASILDEAGSFKL